MLSTVLVLGMLPGLAFFEAGLLNHKTTVSLFMQMFCGLSVLALMWILVGYRFSVYPLSRLLLYSFIPHAVWPSDLMHRPGFLAPLSAISTTYYFMTSASLTLTKNFTFLRALTAIFK